MRSISKKIAWLCLLLMLSSAIAVVAHHHSDANESARCTVCVAAHSAAPTSLHLAPRVTFIAVGTSRTKPVSLNPDGLVGSCNLLQIRARRARLTSGGAEAPKGSAS